MKADKERISQVISNLLSNAIKFTTKEKGTIHVTAVKKGSEVVVSVRDTGQGIEPEMISRLFTKFATESSSGGTGLGLFISKKVLLKPMVVEYGLKIILTEEERPLHLVCQSIRSEREI